MINTLLGVKKNMTATYDSRGRRVGATIVEVGPNFITQVNLSSIQLGFGTKKSVKKPQIGHAKKAGLDQKIRWFREVPTSLKLLGVNEETVVDDIKPGQSITLDQVFSIGDSVKVTGTSKGKGFQGGVRRHGFHGGPKTHGQSDRHRAPGAIGSGTTPGRVYKGKRMAGHMGVDQVSVRNLEVVSIDREKNLLVIKGAIPGSTGGLVKIEKIGRIKGYTPPPEEKPASPDGGQGGPSEEDEATEGGEQKTEAPSEKAEEQPVAGASVEEKKEGEANAG